MVFIYEVPGLLNYNMEEKLQESINTGLAHPDSCIECWSQANKELLDNHDLHLIQLCVLLAERAFQKPNDFRDVSIQLRSDGTSIFVQSLCLEPEATLSGHEFRDRRETLVACVLLAAHWSANTMISFTLNNCFFHEIVKEDGIKQIMMALEPPRGDGSGSSGGGGRRSHIFQACVEEHGKSLEDFFNRHLVTASSGGGSSSSSSTTATSSTSTTSNLKKFVIANVVLGGNYDFGQLLVSNSALEIIALACAECGGASGVNHFPSKGKRLGIGDTFTTKTKTLATLLSSIER